MVTIVLGAGGFIGSHLVKRLKNKGHYVIGADLKHPEFSTSLADEFHIGDLRELSFVRQIIPENCDELYQLAADMGGAGYVFTGDHDADLMLNSAQINLNVVQVAVSKKVKKVFYASSACIYPEYNQLDPDHLKIDEASAYPAQPDSEYGWEKLFSERLYFSFLRNYGLNVKVARFHNVYGEENSYDGGREKAPAALCRKIAKAKQTDTIEIWGDGLQTRSFLYIDDCLDAVQLFMDSSYNGPYNIGSEEMISIRDFALLIAEIANKNISIQSIDGPQGVRGRSSDNTLIEKELNWKPATSLKEGITKLYHWVENEIRSN